MFYYLEQIQIFERGQIPANMGLPSIASVVFVIPVIFRVYL